MYFPMPYIEPCFLLSSTRFDFPQSVLLYTLHSFHNNYFNLALSLSSSSAPGSRQLVCIAYYLVLSFLRSEEHTSELQSPDHLVCCLLLSKKKLTRLIAHKVAKLSCALRLADLSISQ